MNNLIAIAYNGNKPTKAEIEKIAECLTGLKCCKEVEFMKHYDQFSIVDVVSKCATTINFETGEGEPLKNAATFINAHFSSPWDMLSAVATARGMAIRSTDQDALLNAVDIIAGKSKEECEQYGIIPTMYNACYNAKYHILNI